MSESGEEIIEQSNPAPEQSNPAPGPGEAATEESIPAAVPGRKGGKRPGAGRPRNGTFAPCQGDPDYARNLLSLVMRDLDQPIQLRVKCAVVCADPGQLEDRPPPVGLPDSDRRTGRRGCRPARLIGPRDVGAGFRTPPPGRALHRVAVLDQVEAVEGLASAGLVAPAEVEPVED